MLAVGKARPHRPSRQSRLPLKAQLTASSHTSCTDRYRDGRSDGADAGGSRLSGPSEFASVLRRMAGYFFQIRKILPFSEKLVRNLPETSQSCNFSTPPGVTFTPPGVPFTPAGVKNLTTARRLNFTPCHALRSPSRLPRMRIRCASSSYLDPSANEPAEPSRALKIAADAPPPPLKGTFAHLLPSPSSPHPIRRFAAAAHALRAPTHYPSPSRHPDSREPPASAPSDRRSL